MIHRMFAIYDSKAGIFNLPFFLTTPGQAIRAFTDLANDRETTVGRHPVDYTLFEVGTYDDTTAQAVPLATPVSHGLAVSFVTAPPPSTRFPSPAYAAYGHSLGKTAREAERLSRQPPLRGMTIETRLRVRSALGPQLHEGPA